MGDELSGAADVTQAPGTAPTDARTVREAMLAALLTDVDGLVARVEALHTAAAAASPSDSAPGGAERLARLDRAAAQLDGAAKTLLSAGPEYMASLAVHTEAAKASVGAWIVSRTNEAVQAASASVAEAARAEVAKSAGMGHTNGVSDTSLWKVVVAAMFGAAFGSAVALAVALPFVR